MAVVFNPFQAFSGIVANGVFSSTADCQQMALAEETLANAAGHAKLFSGNDGPLLPPLFRHSFFKFSKEIPVELLGQKPPTSPPLTAGAALMAGADFFSRKQTNPEAMLASGFGMSMSMGMAPRLTQTIRMVQELRLPSVLGNPNWRPVEVFKCKGGKPLYLKTIQLPVEGLSPDERFALIDKANAVFHYRYDAERDERGRIHYFRIPLMRDSNISIEDIREKISKSEFGWASAILEGAGEMQRIVRAVHYGRIRGTILGYLTAIGVDLSDIVLVSVDRGGRLPTLITQQALGLDKIHTLKVDQGGRGVDEERWGQFVREETFRGKYIVFVDSTVDSGRQIEILNRRLEEENMKEDLGYKGWVVVGSNEEGKKLNEHHLNINWGVDPDETFEDNENMMGLQYDPDSHSKIMEGPTPLSAAIRRAFLEIPQGVGLDVRPEVIQRHQAIRALLKKELAHLKVVTRSRDWSRATEQEKLGVKPDLGVTADGVKALEENLNAMYNRLGDGKTVDVSPEKRVLVVGSGGKAGGLEEAEAAFIALSVLPHFHLLVGTKKGIPGAVRNAFMACEAVKGVATLYEKEADEDISSEHFGLPVGGMASQRRLEMILRADAILVLPGGVGTLLEARMALLAEKPVIVVRGWGAVARYLITVKPWRDNPNLYVADSLPEAMEILKRKGLDLPEPPKTGERPVETRRVEPKRRGEPVVIVKRKGESPLAHPSPYLPFPPISLRLHGREISETLLADALRRHYGNRQVAARELGMSVDLISDRIQNAIKTSPLRFFRWPFEIDDREVVKALELQGGNVRLAADELGVSISFIAEKLRLAPDGSALRKIKIGLSKPAKAREGRFSVTDSQVADVIGEDGWRLWNEALKAVWDLEDLYRPHRIEMPQPAPVSVPTPASAPRPVAPVPILTPRVPAPQAPSPASVLPTPRSAPAPIVPPAPRMVPVSIPHSPTPQPRLSWVEKVKSAISGFLQKIDRAIGRFKGWFQGY